MSGKVAGLVWRSSLPRTLKPLAALMADYANDDGESIFPSVRTLARKLAASERTVQRHINRLLALHVLEERTSRRGGRRRTCTYRLRLDQLAVKGDKTVTLSAPEKGDSRDAKRVTAVTEKGDTSVTRSVSDPSVIRQFTPPVPPSRRKGGSRRPDKRITRSERRWAENVLKNSRDRPCATYEECIRQLVLDKRKTRTV